MNRPQHTDMIQRDEASTEYNSNQLTVFRIDAIIQRCNMFKKVLNLEGLQYWLIEVQSLDAELEGLLKKEQEEEIAKLRVQQIRQTNTQSPQFIMLQRKKIESYERVVRKFLQFKGLGVTAKIEDDPSHAMTR